MDFKIKDVINKKTLIIYTLVCVITFSLCLLFKKEIDYLIISTLGKIPTQFLPEIATEPDPIHISFFKELSAQIGGVVIGSAVIMAFSLLFKSLKTGFSKILSIFKNK